MRCKLWQVVLVGLCGEFPQPESTRRADYSVWRLLLLAAAGRLFPRCQEGRDYRIVQDQTVIGFHLRGPAGEALEIR